MPADLLEYDELGEVLRATAHASPVPDREAFRAAVMARYHAEQANSWAASLDEWRHDVGLRWAGLSAVGATVACALILFGIAWLVPLDHEGGFTRMPTPKAQVDATFTSYRAAWPQRSINDDVIPAVLSSTREEDRVLALAEEDLVLALAAVVTQGGRRTGPQSLLTSRDDREVVLRLMNAVQHARFTPARDPNGAPVARYVVWLLAHTTVRGKFDRS